MDRLPHRIIQRVLDGESVGAVAKDVNLTPARIWLILRKDTATYHIAKLRNRAALRGSGKRGRQEMLEAADALRQLRLTLKAVADLTDEHMYS